MTSEESDSAQAAGAGDEPSTPPGGLTAAGTELGLGETATVAWVPLAESDGTGAQKGIELKVSVVAIEEGSPGDLKNLELEPDQKGSVPFYVRLKLEAPTSRGIPGNEDPADSFTAIDDRGEEQGSVIFLGSFQPCEEVQPPKQFDSGASFETCSTYLMKAGGSIESVQWDSGPAKANQVTPYFEDPIVWEGTG